MGRRRLFFCGRDAGWTRKGWILEYTYACKRFPCSRGENTYLSVERRGDEARGGVAMSQLRQA